MVKKNESLHEKPITEFVPQHNVGDAAERARRNLNAKLSNPLAGYSHAELRKQGRVFALNHEIGDEEDIRAFELGAVLAQAPERFASIEALTAQEKAILLHEVEHRWSQPKKLYLVIVLCSLSAAVQGMDETTINGAQLWYKHQFGIADDSARSTWILGLITSAPYLCCAFIGCWLTVPFNQWFGRRGTIFITCAFSALSVFWSGFASEWWNLFLSRFALGFGIGPKSATVPIYAAETVPPSIRGALVMQWQMWTAFGIMLGYVADLAFYQITDPSTIVGLNWRFMMGSALIPAVIVLTFVFSCPESPRWYMSQNQYYRAYESMCSLRHHKIQAARDMFYMHTLLEAKKSMKLGQNSIMELIKVPRNRRAMIASQILMFMQQLCGVNVIAYYSSAIFMDANLSAVSSMLVSFGWGVINWLFSIPAIYTIDTFGRRNLLLVTFPLMALAMFFTGFSFWIPEDHNARIICIVLGTYLFGMVYSPGAGSVPFTYSAEAYPLYVRPHGMALATATTWFFNFILGITWPAMQSAFTAEGAFTFYAGGNLVGWWLVLLFMPETKNKTLEELDQVFSVPTKFNVQYGLRQIPYFMKRYVLRQDIKPEVLYEREAVGPVQEDLGYNA
ncbi:uncharacterized protein N7503_008069 [Penicillium pulvis]|uniref:uncharacterized protein n=1 Tax=Penicillium pulvis TaxID=1562058 RepID=UPI0025476011|nr:uncharacterized protein N7503_008069 [Penicillium pulvis]KAJ5792091.1 hypothetical protein N7503_008069 [Penicillium pulvis]